MIAGCSSTNKLCIKNHGNVDPKQFSATSQPLAPTAAFLPHNFDLFGRYHRSLKSMNKTHYDIATVFLALSLTMVLTKSSPAL